MEFLALVYEFVANGSLEDWIKGKKRNSYGGGLNVLERLNIAIDVTCALDYLHHDCEVPVVHCDLKPSNILVDENMTAKLGAFGLARLLMETSGDQGSISSTHVPKGSTGYIPPEYGVGYKATTAGDVYSFGVMLLELFNGKNPTHEDFVGKLNLINWVHSAFPNSLMQVLDPELLLKMMTSEEEDHNRQAMNPQVQQDCMITIIGVALSCTAVCAGGRISIRDALCKLKTVKHTLTAPTPIQIPL